MKCKVTIFHNEWKTVVVDSHEITNWFPAGFDVKAGIVVNVEDWRCEFEDDILAIEAFDDFHVDRCRLQDWISSCIREKYKAESLHERYTIHLPDVIASEYDASFANAEHNFSVSITPMDESKEGTNQ